MTEIIPGLFLGNKQNACDETFLQKNNIARILNCAKEIPPQKNLYCLHIQAEDVSSYDLSQHFVQANEFIHETLESKKNLLVHCVHGVSRSATLVIAYLIVYKNMTCWKAKSFVQNKRPEVSPNDGFWEQLQTLFKKKEPEYLTQKSL